ncbi:MAG: CHAT domain-containing protein, partial [Pseudomonadota bacterium]
LARQRQELAEAWQDAEARVTLAQAIREADGEAIRQEARQQLVSLEEEIALLDQRLRDEVPEFFDLINPSSLDAKAVQRLLSNGEAALLIMPGEFGTHSIAVTPDAIQWHRSELTELEVNRLVARLRASVATSGSPKRFHRKDAYQLYTELVEPLQGILASSQEVYAVPGGSLAALPLAVLVTQEPKGPDVDPQALRETAWLSDRFALVQLPSLQSLLFLRRFNSGDTNYRTDASFAGFGDPDLDGRASSRGGGDTALLRTAYLPNAGGEAAIADVSQLRRLASLPGTQAELIAIQSALGAPVQSVVLGEEATETTVRKTDLSRINVLAFATHGLLAGEVDGIAEPALVFTPPDAPNARDDGLLTASEITTLKLNADWVILSACNTAAGEGGGEGLSGLARAFFYAGARSLLASHWPVRDDIAPNLIVTMILEQQRDPDLSRARALQRAIVEIRSNIADPSSAHPAAWAPFVIVGEGR